MKQLYYIPADFISHLYRETEAKGKYREDIIYIAYIYKERKKQGEQQQQQQKQLPQQEGVKTTVEWQAHSGYMIFSVFINVYIMRNE